MEPPASTPHTSLSAEIKTRAILGTMLTLSIESYKKKHTHTQFYDTNQPVLWYTLYPKLQLWSSGLSTLNFQIPI